MDNWKYDGEEEQLNLDAKELKKLHQKEKSRKEGKIILSDKAELYTFGFAIASRFIFILLLFPGTISILFCSLSNSNVEKAPSIAFWCSLLYIAPLSVILLVVYVLANSTLESKGHLYKLANSNLTNIITLTLFAIFMTVVPVSITKQRVYKEDLAFIIPLFIVIFYLGLLIPYLIRKMMNKMISNTKKYKALSVLEFLINPIQVICFSLVIYPIISCFSLKEGIIYYSIIVFSAIIYTLILIMFKKSAMKDGPRKTIFEAYDITDMKGIIRNTMIIYIIIYAIGAACLSYLGTCEW